MATANNEEVGLNVHLERDLAAYTIIEPNMSAVRKMLMEIDEVKNNLPENHDDLAKFLATRLRIFLVNKAMWFLIDHPLASIFLDNFETEILITYVHEPLLTVTAKTWNMDKVEVGERLEVEACYQFSDTSVPHI
jgi:hypothetical protein